jgi:hypothetical protein
VTEPTANHSFAAAYAQFTLPVVTAVPHSAVQRDMEQADV